MIQMTGRELIIYILTNNLEDELVIDGDGRILDFMTKEEVAKDLNVGIATVDVWIELEMLKPVKIGDTFYISPLDVRTMRRILTEHDDLEEQSGMIAEALKK